jgi:hypothetical protein
MVSLKIAPLACYEAGKAKATSKPKNCLICFLGQPGISTSPRCRRFCYGPKFQPEVFPARTIRSSTGVICLPVCLLL